MNDVPNIDSKSVLYVMLRWLLKVLTNCSDDKQLLVKCLYLLSGVIVKWLSAPLNRTVGCSSPTMMLVA